MSMSSPVSVSEFIGKSFLFIQSLHLHASVQGRPCLTHEYSLLLVEQPDLHAHNIYARIVSGAGG